MLTTLLGGSGAPAKTFRIKIGGIWRDAVPWIKVAGVWKQATPFVRVSGVWK